MVGSSRLHHSPRKWYSFGSQLQTLFPAAHARDRPPGDQRADQGEWQPVPANGRVPRAAFNNQGVTIQFRDVERHAE